MLGIALYNMFTLRIVEANKKCHEVIFMFMKSMDVLLNGLTGQFIANLQPPVQPRGQKPRVIALT